MARIDKLILSMRRNPQGDWRSATLKPSVVITISSVLRRRAVRITSFAMSVFRAG